MIINNSPALGTFNMRDSDGATLDASKSSDKVALSVREGKEWALIDLTPEDQLDFTYWLALQLSPEARLALLKKLEV